MCEIVHLESMNCIKEWIIESMIDLRISFFLLGRRHAIANKGDNLRNINGVNGRAPSTKAVMFDSRSVMKNSMSLS